MEILNGHSSGAMSDLVRKINIINPKTYAKICIGKHREVCADDGSDNELLDVKDDNKGSVMCIAAAPILRE